MTSKITICSEENHQQNVKQEVKSETSQTTKLHSISALISHPYFTPGLYILSGLFLFFSLIVIFDTYVLRLKVEMAVVSAPIETMVAPVGGYITEVFVTNKQQVKKGDPLLKIENIDIERDLQLARLQVEEAKLNVAYYQHLLENEHQRLNVYRNIGSHRVESAETTVNMSKQDLLTAQHNLQRMKVLHRKHYISDASWDAEVTKFVSAQERLKSAKAKKALENNSLGAVDKGMYFTGTKLEGVGRDLLAEFEAAQKKEKINEDKVKIYEHLVDQLIMRAPFDGEVTQVLKSAGNTTDNVKPILFIEQRQTNKNIIAYLTQNEILHIRAPDNVKVYIPSTGKTYYGKIRSIDRTDGFVDIVKAQYRWRDFDLDRSAMVTIEVENKGVKSFDKQAFAGMPAIVYFSRKL
jgi:multidrug resistance efflux pump